MISQPIWDAIQRFSRSLVGRAILISITPLVVFAMAATLYLTAASVSDARTGLLQQGNTIAKSIARAAEYGLYIGDADQLENLIQASLVDPSIHSVKIFNDVGELVASAERDHRDVNPASLQLLSEKVLAAPDEQDLGAYAEKASISPRRRNVLGRIDMELSFAALESRQSRVTLWTVLLVGLSLLATVWFGIYSAYTLLRPFNRIVDTVDRIREGDLGARIEHMSSGELQVLERGINEMAENIQQSQQHLESSVESATARLQSTVEELQSSNEELRMARAAAIKAGDAKAEFLAMVSHELRTPLNSVIGYARLLRDSATEPTTRQHAETIDRAGEHLLGIINDVLDLSRLNANQLEYDEEVFEPVEVVEYALELFAHEAHRKSLELVLHVHRDTPALVLGDRQRLSQVLANLLGNAIKFTREGYVLVEVDAVVNERGEQLQVIVSDTGVGIPPSLRERIFEPFAQADSATDKQFGGTGLGLTIARMMIERMGGQIGVLDSFTEGARLFVHLPAVESAKPAQPMAGLAGKRVLLIESQPFSRRALRAQLINLGLDVTAQADERWMVENHQQLEAKFELIIVSMNRAEVETYQTRERLQLEQCRRVPKLLLIGDEQLARELGSSYARDGLRVITKPASQRRVVSEIQALLGGNSPVPATSATSPAVVTDRLAIVGDDNPEGRELLKILLQRRGIRVLTVGSGAEVLAQIAQLSVDMVFLDLHMPGMDGAATCREIRRLPDIGASLPVIAVTADVMFDGGSGSLAGGGFDDIIYKPLSEAALDDVLLQWFAEADLQVAAVAASADQRLREPQVQAAIERHLAILRDALQQDDRDAFREEAHQLLGVAGFFELAAIRQQLIDLEQLAGSASASQLRRRLDELERLRTSPQNSQA